MSDEGPAVTAVTFDYWNTLCSEPPGGYLRGRRLEAMAQVMVDAGYGADDPALLLTHWKFYLRAVTNAIIDIGIHTADMTQDEAVSLMVDGGFRPGVLDCTRLARWMGHHQVLVNPENKS